MAKCSAVADQLALLGAFALLAAMPRAALASPAVTTGSLKQLCVEELMNVEVHCASRHLEPTQTSPHLWYDVARFYNDYDDLRTGEAGGQLGNLMSGHSSGVDGRLASLHYPAYTELTLIGQNLLDAHHPEQAFAFSGSGMATDVQRGVYGRVTWQL